MAALAHLSLLLTVLAWRALFWAVGFLARAVRAGARGWREGWRSGRRR